MEQSNFEQNKNVLQVCRPMNGCNPPYTAAKSGGGYNLKAQSKFKMPMVFGNGSFQGATAGSHVKAAAVTVKQPFMSGAEKFHRAIARTPPEEWTSDVIKACGAMTPTQMDNCSRTPTHGDQFTSLKNNYLSCSDLQATIFLDQEINGARGAGIETTSAESEPTSKKAHYRIIKRENKKHFEQRDSKTIQANSQNGKHGESMPNNKEKNRGRKSTQIGNRFHCAPHSLPSITSDSNIESEASLYNVNNSKRRSAGRDSSSHPNFRTGGNHSNNISSSNNNNNNNNSNQNSCNNINVAYSNNKGMLIAENSVNCNYCNTKLSPPHKISKKKRISSEASINNVRNIKQFLFRVCSDEEISQRPCYNGVGGGGPISSTQSMDVCCSNDETGDFLTPILLNSAHSYSANASQLLLNILAENFALNMSDMDIINFALRQERNRRMSYTKSFANIIASRAVAAAAAAMAGDLKFKHHPQSANVYPPPAELSSSSSVHPMLRNLCSLPRTEFKRFNSIYTNA